MKILYFISLKIICALTYTIHILYYHLHLKQYSLNCINKAAVWYSYRELNEILYAKTTFNSIVRSRNILALLSLN